MVMTIQEKDTIREKELQDIVAKAIEDGVSYGSISKQPFSDGTKVRTYVERAYGGIIPFCERYNLPMDTIVPVNHLVDYKASKLTEDEVIERIKEMHKGLERGFTETRVKSSVDGRILIAASRRIYGYWDVAIKEAGIIPARANEDMIIEYTPEIIKLYSEGVPISRIGEVVPISHSTIKRVLVDNGFTIISAQEWSSINNPVLYDKQEVDEYIKYLLNLSIERKVTVGTVKKDNPEMLRAIKYYYKSFRNAFVNRGEYLLDKKIPKSWNREFLIAQLKLGASLGKPLNSSYFTYNCPSTENYARKEFGSWENALVEADIPLDAVYIGAAEFSKLGHTFEDILGQILVELGYSLLDSPHDRWQPDFAVGNKWIDAKLSEYTHTSKDKSGLTVIEKYEPCCDELELVFLRGNRKTSRKLSGKTTLIHVSHYVNKLPESRRDHYNEILTQIEREANAIEYQKGA